MSKYFQYFPTTENDLKQNGQSTTVTNILKRFIFKTSLEKTSRVFYEYTIQDGDRPDTIAEKYYGDAKHAWIILHFNNIKDPIFDWPLYGYYFEEYIEGKYGSVATAASTIKEYRKILTQRTVNYDGSMTPERYVVVDQTTYNQTPNNQRRALSIYDYETELNEEKAKIKLLNNEYLDQCLAEVQNILSDGV
jgi:hypothetical protein